jgi:hypothetical protein
MINRKSFAAEAQRTPRKPIFLHRKEAKDARIKMKNQKTGVPQVGAGAFAPNPTGYALR